MSSASPVAWAGLALGSAALLLSLSQHLRLRRRKVIPNSGPTAAFYNAAQVYGGIAYVSGQVGLRSGVLVGDTAASQTPVAIENLLAALEACGSSKDKILKTTVYLADIADYSAFNEVYTRYFTDDDTRPARVCFAAKQLPLGAKMEIECIAMV